MCHIMKKVRIGFFTSVTLKPMDFTLLPKYRQELQVQKQQPLKMTKVHFTSVLILCLSGRQIITEKKDL